MPEITTCGITKETLIKSISPDSKEELIKCMHQIFVSLYKLSGRRANSKDAGKMYAKPPGMIGTAVF